MYPLTSRSTSLRNDPFQIEAAESFAIMAKDRLMGPLDLQACLLPIICRNINKEKSGEVMRMVVACMNPSKKKGFPFAMPMRHALMHAEGTARISFRGCSGVTLVF